MKEYINLTKEQALQKAKEDGYMVFISYEDNDTFIKTMDFNTNRINLGIIDGVIITAELG